MRIIGFDPSLKQTGYAIVDYPDNSIVSAGIIKTDAKNEFVDRIMEINNSAEDIIKKYKPKHAVFEESFYSKNVKSAQILAQVRIILIVLAKQNNCTISLFSPNRIKKAVTGQGHASKEQIAYMVKNIFSLEDKNVPDDVTDALACVYTFISRSF